MLVMILERVTPSLRGELTRWLIEPHPGVFIGDVSALVRDRLWDKCRQRLRGGALIQAWNTNNEQGFALRCEGLTEREMVTYDGLWLVRLRNRKPSEPKAAKREPAQAKE